MRSYEQYCAVAKALDVVGDRWTLLIARELLLRGPSRYTDLRHGLPGIATNLLADRLRELEEAGLVGRVDAPPPIATTLFELTPRGRELEPILAALGRWGVPMMARPGENDEFRPHWLAFLAAHLLTDHSPDDPPITIEIRAGDQPVVIETADGAVRVRPGSAEQPAAILTGPPAALLGVLTGRLDLAKARRRGLRFQGDTNALRRIQPLPPIAR